MYKQKFNEGFTKANFLESQSQEAKQKEIRICSQRFRETVERQKQDAFKRIEQKVVK